MILNMVLTFDLPYFISSRRMGFNLLAMCQYSGHLMFHKIMIECTSTAEDNYLQVVTVDDVVVVVEEVEAETKY